jgi:hypothetical protein
LIASTVPDRAPSLAIVIGTMNTSNGDSGLSGSV